MISKSVLQTHKFAEQITHKVLQQQLYYTNNGKQAIIFVLIGALGSGKTEFTKGLAMALHIKTQILSPTFLIMRKYNNFYHLDCYRLLPHPDDTLETLAFNEIINDPKNIVVIEWAEHLNILKYYRTIKIYFKAIHQHTNWRDIQVQYKNAKLINTLKTNNS